jgi:hypothetical protein
MNYGEVLSKAWKIIWHNKVLWIFGILAGCGGSRNGGGGNSFNYRTSGNQFPGGPDGQFTELGERILAFFQGIPPYVYVLVALAVLALILLGLYLSTIGRIGLVLGALRGDNGAERQSLGKLWGDSQPYFWRMFLLNLLIAVIGFVIFLIILIPVLGVGLLTAGIGLICILPVICIIGIASWFVNIVIEQSAVALVAENLGVIDSLRRGWQVFRNNFGSLTLLALIVMIAGFVTGLALAIPVFVTVLPATFQLMRGGEFSFGPLLQVALVLLALYMPVLIFLNGVIQSYIGSVWALAFRRLTATPAAGSIRPATPEPPSGAAVY